MVGITQLVSHRFRGFSEKENTVEGLNAALDFGVAQVEFDIQNYRWSLCSHANSRSSLYRSGGT